MSEDEKERKPEPTIAHVGHILYKGSPNCPECDAPPSKHEVRNHSLIWHDGDVHCTECGAYVRKYDAG